MTPGYRALRESAAWLDLAGRGKIGGGQLIIDSQGSGGSLMTGLAAPKVVRREEDRLAMVDLQCGGTAQRARLAGRAVSRSRTAGSTIS